MPIILRSLWSYTIAGPSRITQILTMVQTQTLLVPPGQPSNTNTRVSTTVPLSETHYEAMDFALWRTIGNQTLIKSNISNWIACMDGTGSIVRQKVRSLSCKLEFQNIG